MFSIDHIQSILNHHGNFHLNLKAIHVGGTNGKGSTSLMIQNILIASGYQVGIYTSPFDMGRFDNININQEQITPEDVMRLNRQYSDDFQLFQLTPFEIDTFLALAYFFEQKVDYAVIEVGLGGKDDATNVVMPILSVITNIGLDHQDVLGYGYTNVASHKAGIIKPKVPVVLGHDINDEALHVLESYAKAMKSTIYHVKSFSVKQRTPRIEMMYQHQVYHLNTLADYQARNASLAIEVASILQSLGIAIMDEHIQKGIAMGVPPKRFQILSTSPMIIIDGAHNLEGIVRLIESIKLLQLNSKIRVIAAILKDKPYREMIEKLFELSDDVTLTTFDHERALQLETFSHPLVHVELDYHRALQTIFDHQDYVHLITGSLYFLAYAVNDLKGMISR